jgi:hypothetical protein
MRQSRALRILKVVLFVAVAATALGFVVMLLWNRLMPALFGLHTLSFWQAIGLLILSKILFGGFHGRPGFVAPWRQRIFERWDQMTPEEREKFRAGLRGGCGPFGASPEAPKA